MARSNGSLAPRTPDDAASKAVHGEANRPDVSNAATIAVKLESLQRMDYAALRHEWRRLYRAPAPQRVGRDLLMLAVAWKLQEPALGGLGVANRRRLVDLAQTLERDGDVTRNRVARLMSGAKLVREWRGETHTVRVLEDGFEWKGQHWRSLSVIAREISGGHWSGPRFFGLAGKRAEPVEASHG